MTYAFMWWIFAAVSVCGGVLCFLHNHRWGGVALFVAAAAMGIFAFVSAAHAADEPWRPVVRQCDEEAERTFCVGKAGCPNWEWLSACAAQNYYRSIPVAPSQSRYVSCVERVKRTRTTQRMCASCGDPVAEVFLCLGQ